MNSKKIYTIVFSLIALLILFGFVWSWYVTKDIRSNTDMAGQQEQKVTVSNLILTETKDAQKYWELYAKKGYYTSGTEIAILEDIIGNFYDENNEVILSFHECLQFLFIRNYEANQIIKIIPTLTQLDDINVTTAEKQFSNPNNNLIKVDLPQPVLPTIAMY